MELCCDETHQLVESVWAAVLGLEVRPDPEAPVLLSHADVLTGCVEVRGAWEGSVVLACPAELTARVAGIMFDTPPHAVTTEQARDALGELTNILGGGLKALLPGPSALGLPVVVAGAGHPGVGSGPPFFQAAYLCLNQPLLLTVLCRGGSPGQDRSGR